jgi:ubiquinone/menaquinone biosynthesis C-methylase UbiE
MRRMGDAGRWSSTEVADAWRRGAEARSRTFGPATDAMFDAAGVVPGARVLDLGTGTGDTAVLAAGRVGPNGHVLATDVSPAMVEAAQASVQEAGARNVSTRTMGADDIDVEAESVDAVVARLVLMFVGDLAGTLRGVRRALRPGGRFAAVVWGPPDRNPYHRILFDAARAHGGLPDPEPEVVRAFSLCDGAALERALGGAGFCEARIRFVESRREFASAAEARANASESPLLAAVFSALGREERARAWMHVEREYGAFERDGACVFPGVLLVASGEKPRV